MSRLILHLFGAPSIELDGMPIKTDRRKAIALLTYLAIEGGRHTREELTAVFWPDFDASRAAVHLRRTLWEISQILGEGWIVTDGDAVQFAPNADVWLDVRRFDNLVTESRGHSHRHADCAVSEAPLGEAVNLQRADFLSGFNLKDAPAFDEWSFFQAEGLRRELAQALERLARCHLESGRAHDAIPLARRWLSLDPLNEAAHRQLMQAYARGGDHAAAIRQYQECARALNAELGVLPQPETTALYEQICRDASEEKQAPANAGEDPRPGSAAPGPRSRLPAQPTPFVGRAHELAQIASLLGNPECRLITLLGPGGAGKTRIAAQAALDHAPAFAGGAHFVALAPLVSPDDIVPAVADAIGFSFFGLADRADPRARQQLLAYLSEKRMLIVLDNFEHIIAGADWVADLLQEAPEVKVIATSRERLNLREEWVVEVRGMSIPDTDARDLSLDENSALRLFMNSARRASASYSLADAQRPHVVRICRLVEGLPLGIELAAAWTKALSPHEIADEIERSMDFLTTALRNAPERHRSLRAVFDSSWALLTPEQQRMFQRLPAFHGGFTREAALAVSGASLPALGAFVDKSLLYRDASGRYDLHQAVRQYAAEKHEANPDDRATTLKRHAAYYGDFVRARTPSLRDHGQRQALADIKAEWENIRAGWRHVLTLGDDAARASLIDSYLDGLFWFTDMQGRFLEGAAWADAALSAFAAHSDAPPNLPEAQALIVARLLMWRGWCYFRTSQGARSSADMNAALALMAQHPNIAPIARAFINVFALYSGAVRDRAKVERMFDETLDAFRESRDTWGIAMALAALAEMGADPDTAKKLYQESLAMRRAAGDERSVASLLREYGELLHNLGEFGPARRAFDESLALARSLQDRYAMSVGLDYVGYLARQMGDLDEARRLHEESLALSREIGDTQGIAGSLDNLGLVEFDAGHVAAAERLFAEGYALRKGHDEPWAGVAGFSIEHLSATALASGDAARAEQLARESMALLPHWTIARARLGDALRAQGKLGAALQQYREALALAVQENHVWCACVSVLGLSRLAADQGDCARAVTLATFLARHMTCDDATRRVAERDLSAWQAKLSPETAAQAQAAAATLSLQGLLDALPVDAGAVPAS